MAVAIYLILKPKTNIKVYANKEVYNTFIKTILFNKNIKT